MVKTAPPNVQLVTGQYELGKEASLIPKAVLISAAATVMDVPLIWTRKVDIKATMVIRSLRDLDQLNGLCGSRGPSQSTIWISGSFWSAC